MSSVPPTYISNIFLLKLHIDSGTEAPAPQEKKEEDFFAVTEAFPDTTFVNTNGSSLMPQKTIVRTTSDFYYDPFKQKYFLHQQVAEPVKPKDASESEDQGAGPNVNVINNPPAHVNYYH